jgi:hypothetical protein
MRSALLLNGRVNAPMACIWWIARLLALLLALAAGAANAQFTFTNLTNSVAVSGVVNAGAYAYYSYSWPGHPLQGEEQGNRQARVRSHVPTAKNGAVLHTPWCLRQVPASGLALTTWVCTPPQPVHPACVPHVSNPSHHAAQERPLRWWRWLATPTCLSHWCHPPWGSLEALW